MQILKVTDYDSKRQRHIVYLNAETETGKMSAAKDGHVQEIYYDPPREPRPPAPAIPPQIDPMTGAVAIIQNPETGEMMPDPGTPEDPGDPGKEKGEWIVAPGGEDGHEHTIFDYRAKAKKVKESSKDILDECMSLWKEGLELTRESRKLGVESEGMYKGDAQWDPEVKKKLAGLDRAALTINEIAPAIDTLIGYQMEQRTDIRFLPQENGDQRVADMLNIVTKKVLDQCYFPREETKIFKDACVPGMGNFHVYMDFNESIQGNIKVERFPWEDIVYGPHEKEDLSDCEFEVRSRMYSLAKVTQMFPKKAKEIEKSFRDYKSFQPDLGSRKTGTHGDYRPNGSTESENLPYTVDGTFPLVDVQKKQFRVAQISRKTYQQVSVLFNQEDNFFFTAYDWDDADIMAAASIEGMQTISQLKTRMRITRICANVILSDENPAELPMHDFYTVPVYGYRQNGEYWGKVQIAKDPQRELNKRRSQMMDIMNRLGASVYYVDPETFVDKNELEKFKKNRSKPGSVFHVNDLGRTPQLEQGADIPASLMNIMQMDQQNLQRLMNVITEQGGANESGMMFMEKKKSRLVGNQILFDNLAFAKQKLGKIIVALIKEYYPAERLERLLNAQYSRSKFQVAGEDYGKFSSEEIVELLECADLMEYDVIVTESSFAPSTRLGIAQMLFDGISKGMDIPLDLPIEFIDAPAEIKTKIMERMQAQSDQMSQQATETSNTEIKKTAIASGGYTISPEEAQRMGLIPTSENNSLPNAQNVQDNDANNSSQATEYANNLASSLAG